MTTGIVLIAAILVLGGVIATVGDRLGMRVGKARLSLFGLRPRQTATLITVMTGIIVSASTFGILFAVDDQLRKGVFELDEIQDELVEAQEELSQAENKTRQTQTDLKQTQTDLRRSIAQQRAAQRRLQRINRSLRQAVVQQEQTQLQLGTTQQQLSRVQTNYQQAQFLLRNISQQAGSLRREVQQLQADRQQQIAQRDREIALRDTEIAERDEAIQQRNQAIAEREAQLDELERQRSVLLQEIQNREQELIVLRRGNVAFLRNQTLADGVVRVVSPSAAPQALDQLLREANQLALQQIRPGADSANYQIIQIPVTQVDQVIEQIRDGEDYVIRILSAGNYVVGEPCVLAGEACVQVYASVALNQIVFEDAEVVASTTVNPSVVEDGVLAERINLLIVGSQFRARQAGIADDRIQIADGRAETVIAFFDQLRQYDQPIEVQVVSAETAYTAGPIQLELIAVQDGQLLFSTYLEETP
ncbi:MAG: DUF3084 domain-containing protein [Leptolyngbyaceae cyanobacterium SL_7_1]|nr:DUF3084 domain-containing protein [Leptolyngbyaceae cyanobacterium SL_7_1]